MSVTFPTSTQATSADANNGAENSVAVNPPAELAAGDVWTIIVCLDHGGSGVINVPDGWLAAHAQLDGNPGYPSILTIWKFAGEEEAAVTIEVETGVYVHWCASVRGAASEGWHAEGPIGNVVPSVPTETGTTVAAPSVPVAADGSGVLTAIGIIDGSNSGPITAPANTTPLQQRSGASQFPWAAVAAASVDQGTFVPGSWGGLASFNEGRVLVSIEFRPAAAGGSVQLSVDSATHAHAADAPTLAAGLQLAVADAAHAHAAASPELQQEFQLSVDDTTHAHAADSPTLSQSLGLVVADSVHAHAAEAPALTQASTVVVASATHAHTAESPVLAPAGSLVVASAAHGHIAESPALSLTALLEVLGALHGHVVDSPELALGNALAVLDALHAHAADEVLLTQAHLLVVAEALHLHRADTVFLRELRRLALLELSVRHPLGLTLTASPSED